MVIVFASQEWSGGAVCRVSSYTGTTHRFKHILYMKPEDKAISEFEKTFVVALQTITREITAPFYPPELEKQSIAAAAALFYNTTYIVKTRKLMVTPFSQDRLEAEQAAAKRFIEEILKATNEFLQFHEPIESWPDIVGEKE